MISEIQGAPPGRALAPLIVGVTGKLDLAGADDAVRAALDLMFDRLDARCPHSPKVLLSALARGADTVAAEAALARAGWEVVAPLPMSVANYLDDFDEVGARELHALLAHPKVRTLILDPLRTAHRGPHIPETDLIRKPGVSNLARKDHYEQGGLFIAERAAIMIAVMREDEQPGKVGGTARILRHRLTGELDASSADIVRRSDCLVEPPRLDDRFTGPAWIVDLGRLSEAPDNPEGALRVWTPDAPAPAPLTDPAALAGSLAMAESLDALNARVAGLSEAAWAQVERSAGPDIGDAASRLRRVQAGISTVQSQMNRRIRRRVWLLAGLFCAAVISFEVYSDLSVYPFTSAASALYVACVLAAVAIYSHAARRKWQRLAEDYRAAAEALRVQLVWWDSGLSGRDHAIVHFYLRGARGPFKLLKIWINQLIDGAVLRCAPPAGRPDAADEWIADQIAFFDARIAARRASIRFVEGSGWVLFALSLGAAFCLVLMQVSAPGLWLTATHLAPVNRVILLIAGLALIGWLFLDTARAPLAEHDGEEPPPVATRPDWINGLIAGLVLTAALCDLATLMPPTVEPDPGLSAMFALAKELVAMAVIIPAALAGAIRFVAEKLSWDAELTGYVHTRENFRRGQISLARAEAGGADAEEERRHLLRALGGEALGENEAWLRAHRQRPLEPVVGG